MDSMFDWHVCVQYITIALCGERRKASETSSAAGTTANVVANRLVTDRSGAAMFGERRLIDLQRGLGLCTVRPP